MILDIDIPGGIGTSMIKGVKGLRPDLMILMSSAADEEQNALDYITAGAEGYL